MSGFIRFCIKNPVFVWCVVIMLAVLGVFNYAKLGVTLYPDISPATVLVRTAYEGASPEEVERLVTEPLEDALADLSGLKSMTSYSQDGVSLLGLELDEGLDIDLKIIDVENKISRVRGGLPDDASEPVTMKMSLSEEPFLIASFKSDLPETEAKRTVDEEIKPRISRIEGVSQVLVSGGLDREIQIALDPLALQEHGISYDDVFACVARNNTVEPSGYVTRETDRVSLRMAGEFGGVDEIRKVMIPAAGGHPIPLELLGDVVDGARDRESIARAGGGRVIQLQVSGRVNADLVKAGEAVKSEISRLAGGMPGFTVSYTLDDTGFVQKSVKNVIRDTIAGIALTSLVIYLFMGRLSAALIVASVMPIAFVSVFSPMRMHGYSLNLITALALALSMGVLVDNAILLIENIYRCRDMGCGPFEAAERGAAEISVSVMAGTLTNIGVFLPVAMLSGLPGQTLAPYAVTILYSTLIALWVTLSVIPMMAARALGGASGMPRSGRVLTGWWNWLFDGFQDLFMLLMRKTLHRPALTIFSFLALSAGAFMMAGNLGTETLPVSDDGTITISLKLSNDASLEAAERKTVLVEDFVLSMAEAGAIEHVTSAVGAGGMDQSPFKSKITVTLKDAPDRPATADVAGKIRAYLNAMPGIEFSVLATRPGFGRDPIEIHVKGQDMSELFTIAGEILLKGKDVPGIIDLQPATEMGRPELRIVPMRWNLARLGVDISGLTRTMKGYLNGNKAGELRSGGSECDIVVRLCPEKTRDIYAMNQMPIMTKRGPVPLGEMAAMEWGSAPTEIRRIERERTLMITGNVQNISAGEGIAKMREILGSLTLPVGYSAQMAGEADEMDDIGGEMAWAVIFAVTATYLIVASILGSWAYALVILLTVPMAAIGVVPLMLATGANMSLFAGIGIVMLIGLVVNNAIVVVDCAESLRKNENLPPGEAIERACEVRFKSVAMGAVTSIVSFMPLALSTGRGSEFRAPIAAVAIGGLAAGGLLALLVIPAAFALCWKIKDRLGFAKA